MVIKSAEYLREFKTGKTCWGIEQKGKNERQRESRLGRERQWRGREKTTWVIGKDGPV
jgi:hypothetical protein